MAAPDPQSHLATSQARTVAYLLDLVACALLLIPTAYAAWCLGTPSAGAFEYALLFFAYHTYFLVFRGGASPGKHVQNILVVTPNGRAIGAIPALLRSASLAMPWLLVAAGDSAAVSSLLSRAGAASLPTAGIAWLVADALLIEYTRDRRSLTDRIAGTVVVALPPLEPHRAPAVPMFSANDAEFGRPPKKPPRR